MSNTDTNFVICPYDKSHVLSRRRLQQHLLRCRQNHPTIKLRKCPFNQIHLLTENDYDNHLLNCTDRKLIEQYKYTDANKNELSLMSPPKNQAPIECEEDWDDVDVVDYNPKKYAANAFVIRKSHHFNKKKRKEFNYNEGLRLMRIQQENEINNNNNKENANKLPQK